MISGVGQRAALQLKFTAPFRAVPVRVARYCTALQGVATGQSRHSFTERISQYQGKFANAILSESTAVLSVGMRNGIAY
jgi:hypothetical protein